jgi:hypothetical protein
VSLKVTHIYIYTHVYTYIYMCSSKYVALLETKNILTKYICDLTDTYFVYYIITQRDVTYKIVLIKFQLV